MSTLFTCKGLEKSYDKVHALNDLDLTIQSGRIVGLLGPNGSGKTTLLKLANGLLVPSAGEVLIDGHAPGQQTHSLVSYLPDRPSLPQWMTIRQLQDFYADFFPDFDRDRCREMLDKLEIPSHRKLKDLSKGNREKVHLVHTMSRQARLYLLDEPMGGVDPAARDFILETILQNYDPEATVVIATHLIADVEKVLDEVIFLDQGKVALHTSVDDLRAETGKSVDALFREVFQC